VYEVTVGGMICQLCGYVWEQSTVREQVETTFKNKRPVRAGQYLSTRRAQNILSRSSRCVCVCVCVCMCVRVHVCVCLCLCVFVFCVYIYICMCVWVIVLLFVLVHMCV